MLPTIRPADIILVSRDSWPSRLIRFGTTTHGEPKSIASHAAIGIATPSMIVEALPPRVARRHLNVYRFSGAKIKIYRPLNLSTAECCAIARAAESFIGAKYGWGKILLHALDGVLWRTPLLGRALAGRSVFARLGRLDQWPICSYLVARAYTEGAGKHFGVGPATASPDDIDDFAAGHPDKFEVVADWFMP